MPILSIQSRVASGYVGNAAATPLLQRLGHTVWPIDTVAFSNHPAHGPFRGGARPATEIADLADGLEARGLFGSCDALLSGYLGTAENGQAILSVAERVRTTNPVAVWLCDPVMGDNGAFYVADGIPEFFRDIALPRADIVLPNAFEASFLSGVATDTVDGATRAAAALLEKGPETVVVTGVRHGTSIGAVAAAGDGCWRCMAPMIEAAAHGAGDAFAALFTGYFLPSRNVPRSLGLAVSGVQAILRVTADAQAGDLCLVEALPKLDTLKPLPVKKVS